VRQVAYTLRIGILTHYHASLEALNHPLTALAVETLVRSEPEAFAHLAWVAHGEPLSNRTKNAWRKHCHSDNRRRWSHPATRALCWRLGDARNYHKNLLRANPSAKDSRATTAARRQLQRLETLHDATGCPGRDGMGETTETSNQCSPDLPAGLGSGGYPIYGEHIRPLHTKGHPFGYELLPVQGPYNTVAP
jgi:hypothetical protein